MVYEISYPIKITLSFAYRCEGVHLPVVIHTAALFRYLLWHVRAQVPPHTS